MWTCMLFEDVSLSVGVGLLSAMCATYAFQDQMVTHLV